ncbi:Serine/threonine-protein kinase PrkC [Luteitalea pratensis]|uniref:Serine/threonine-protein kinase PrkC n=1 Tax=Luteitalea pratensis TaxID=1855912 RepID=A0A143PKD3_LUTPR|nr:serine/threonine-protein kinase [Luteitalea pratensis]AMY08713.1 Serine/threonine-protein kinase PrkC [Luteitalea pratensis]
MSELALLDDVRRRVADREAVDWDACTRDPQLARALSDDDLRELAFLRVLDEIGVVHSQLQTGDLLGGEDGTDTPAAVRAADDDTLTAWGRYRLDEKVGRGGFGSVYRAWDPVLEMPVAIKILHRRYGDRQLTDRLLREGRALAQITHPHVVRVLNVEEHEGRLGLVMEFLRGETMDAMIESQGAMNDREATVIVEDVCRALAVVHAHGLVHRDVKARNIIREHAGRIVLMDFGAGLSQRPSDDEAAAVGTPLYSAPETLRGAAATPASDVYSVGVLLYHLVSGRYPYEGRSVDAIQDAQARGADVSAALLALRPNVPMSFVLVVERALAIDPHERYESAAALLRDLAGTHEAAVPWKQWVVRALVGTGALLVVLTLAGMLTAANYNQVLGRSAFSTDTVFDYLRLGRRSLLMPMVLALLGAGVIGALFALRNVLVAASATVRAFDTRVLSACDRAAGRLGLADPGVCACWIALLTAAVLGAVWFTYAPLLHAVTRDASTAAPDLLRELSPAHEQDPIYYRMVLALTGATSVTLWCLLARTTRARSQRLPGWFVPVQVSILVLLYASMQLPYRLANDADEFGVVTWRGQQCHVLGTKAGEALLFCPSLQPRRRLVNTASEPLPPVGEPTHLFAAFGPRSN